MDAPTRTVSLVTGGVRGLGLAVARRLRARGELVHIVYRSSSDAALALSDEFEGRVHRADLTRPEEWNALVERVLERDGGCDHFVHGVGEYVHGPLSDAKSTELRRMLASNVESAFDGFHAVRALLRARGGTAVFFGCAGLETSRARRDAAVYVAAKSALLVLVRAWALEEAPHRVRVHMVSPGHIPHPHASDDTLDPALWARIPMQRPGSPEDVAAAVAWLCSDQAEYLTGINLDVAGGFML